MLAGTEFPNGGSSDSFRKNQKVWQVCVACYFLSSYCGFTGIAPFAGYLNPAGQAARHSISPEYQLRSALHAYAAFGIRYLLATGVILLLPKLYTNRQIAGYGFGIFKYLHSEFILGNITDISYKAMETTGKKPIRARNGQMQGKSGNRQ
jgi:hypothetical protein